MKGMSRSSKLPSKLLLVSCSFLVGEELSWSGLMLGDWVTSNELSLAVHALSASSWPMRLVTLCAKSGGLVGQSGLCVFDRTLTFPGVKKGKTN